MRNYNKLMYICQLQKSAASMDEGPAGALESYINTAGKLKENRAVVVAGSTGAGVGLGSGLGGLAGYLAGSGIGGAIANGTQDAGASAEEIEKRKKRYKLIAGILGVVPGALIGGGVGGFAGALEGARSAEPIYQEGQKLLPQLWKDYRNSRSPAQVTADGLAEQGAKKYIFG